MPLIHSKSKKAVGKNIEAEMKAGKPQKQSIAIALDIQRRAPKKKKKMAEGGKVNESAASEHRPSTEETDKDSKEVSKNSGNKSPKHDSWTDKSTETQAQSNNGRKVKPIKHPSMVPTNAFSTKLSGEEDHLEMYAHPASPEEQPPKSDDEEGADRQGPDTPALHMKKMFEGGAVSEKASENDNSEHPAGLEEDDDQQRPSKSDYMEEHDAAQYAGGGEITERSQELDSEEPEHDKEYHSEEEALDHHASMVASIMARRRARYAQGGEIKSHDSIYSDESSQADLSRNADEDANEEDQSSFNALRKENYSESEGLRQLDSPSDSNEDGREIEADEHDMISRIRAKMKAKR